MKSPTTALLPCMLLALLASLASAAPMRKPMDLRRRALEARSRKFVDSATPSFIGAAATPLGSAWYSASRSAAATLRLAAAAQASSSSAKKTTTTSIKKSTTSTKKKTTSTKKKTTTSKKKTTTSKKKTTTTTTTTTTTKKTTTTTKKATTTTSKTTTVPATATAWPQNGGLLAAGYYPDWQYDVLAPEDLDFSLLDLIDFAFLLPTSSNGLAWGDSSVSPGLLKRLVSLGHANDTKIVISIGGWDNSNYFSTMAATASGRQTFANNIMTIVDKYGVDGVDIDWEYPGTTGADGNAVSTADTANFLLFLKALRQKLGSAKRLSACVTQEAFIGADGSPLADVSDFAGELDAILVMNYDVWGASSTPGPNAPLSDACDNSQQPDANEKASIAAWTAAGMPASKILMGVPAYGYVSSSSKTTLVHKRDVVPTSAEEILKRGEIPAGLSNRDRAAFLRKRAVEAAAKPQSPLAKRAYPREATSPLRRWYETSSAAATKRRAEAKRTARRSVNIAGAGEVQKRGSVIVCPNNHSGNPCNGITDQNITAIDWAPSASSSSSSSEVTNSTTGVFAGSSGVSKVGTGDVSSYSGSQVYFNQLISAGVLQYNSSTKLYEGINGYTRVWDTCSSTPYLYDTSRKVVITYDDPVSLKLKGKMALAAGLQGMNVWDLSGDTSSWVLLKNWRMAMGAGTKVLGEALDTSMY